MLAEINGSDAGVTMQYSRLKDAFTITSNSTGADSTVTVSNLTGNAFGSSGAFGIGTGILATGQNSIAVIDGVTVERDSNSYTIDGVSYNHTQITDLSNEQATFTVTRDFSSTVDAVKTFVDGLNTLLTKFTTLLGEKSYANSYKPLTDAQRDEMSEKEIEQWEEKAKSGLLRHNSALSGLVTSLKGVFYSPAGGTGSNASAIGIATGNYYDTNKGLLVVDTEALTKALSEDPDYVISMFTGGSSTAASSDQGLIYKLRSALTAYQKNTADTIEETEDKIDKTDESIDSLKKKLSALAEKYYQKFSVMETALAKLNSQASYISQLFS
ncbi:Flagellar hook-associated protein 2 [bioreactor metagenome]|uniref:Flagellar hook-associated protein 2 n=1 Tax=bioreactor metagenome TaxID=1076179 RepID=A0A644XIG0_9ZZZZ